MVLLVQRDTLVLPVLKERLVELLVLQELPVLKVRMVLLEQPALKAILVGLPGHKVKQVRLALLDLLGLLAT
jgi:hypothetical protein